MKHSSILCVPAGSSRTGRQYPIVLPLLGILFFFSASGLSAQESAFDFGLSYQTEGQWGYTPHPQGETARSQAAWANLLELDFGLRLWPGARLSVATLSSYDTHDGVVADRQTCSNLLTDNRWLRLFEAGLYQEWERLWLFAGLGHINHHYFAGGYEGLFTGSSHGIFPTVGDNFGMGNFPVATLGLHWGVLITDRIEWRGVLTQGSGSDRLREQFSLTDKGFDIVSEVCYTAVPGDDLSGHWHLGGVYGREPDFTGTAVFAYGEHPVWQQGHRQAGCFLQGSLASAGAACRAYYGGGLYSQGLLARGHELGLAVARAVYDDGDEWDTELCYAFPLADILTVKPALHLINTDGRWAQVALLRAVVEW